MALRWTLLRGKVYARVRARCLAFPAFFENPVIIADASLHLNMHCVDSRAVVFRQDRVYAGKTALHYAAQRGFVDIVRVLGKRATIDKGPLLPFLYWSWFTVVSLTTFSVSSNLALRPPSNAFVLHLCP